MKNRNFLGLGKATTILLGVCLFCLGTVKAQVVAESSVPANTVKAFKAASQGSSAIWMQGPNNSYEATWMKEGQNMVYVFDQTGQLQQKKYVSGIKAMPAGVAQGIAAAYPTSKVDAAYKVITRTNQKFYEVQVAGAQSVDRLRFDLEGKPIGKTTVATSIAAAPEKSQPIASNAAVKEKEEQPVAMRGEAANVSTTTTDADLLDEDLGDLLEDDEDLGDLLDDEDENWEDINLDDEVEEDDDLLNIEDESDDIDFDIEDSEDGDGF